MTDEKNVGLSGSWHGNYYYSSATNPYGFEAVLIESEGVITGNILDLGSLGEANVTGTFACPRLDFIKVYYKSAQASANYDGTLSSDGKTMTGTWKIPPLVRGTWIAWRIEEKEDFDDVSMEETVEEEKETQRPLVMPGR